MIPLFIVIFITLISSPVQAQTNTPTPTDQDLFGQYKTDFQYQQDLYQESYLKYIDKKQIHTKYGTITTQSDKDEATKNVLINRNDMLKAYLLALRVKLNFYITPETFYDTQKIKIEIYKWEDWLVEQDLIVNSLNNENDIQQWAKEFQNKYETIKQQINIALIQNELNLRYTALQTTKSLTDDVRIYKNIPKENQTWLTSVAIKTDQITSSLKKAKNIVSSYDSSNSYTQSKKELINSTNYFYDIISILKAIIIQNS